MLNTQEISNSAQSIARELGITKYDIYGSSVDETSVEVDNGEPKQVQASNRSSVIVRVWNEQEMVGVTTTTDLDIQGLQLALKTAQEASLLGNKDNPPEFSPEAKEPLPNVSDEVVEPAPVPVLMETLIKAEKTLLEAHPAIMGVPYNGLSQEDIARFYLNSDGALRQETRSYASIYLYSRTEQEGKKPRGASAMKISHGLSDLDIDGCLKEVTEKTISHINYQSIPSGKYRVVFSPTAFLSLISAFSNLFNAQNILDKQSLSTPESLGTEIASPLLCLCDNALHPDNIGAETFDGEGTPTRPVDIIKNGILTGLLHSTGTAKRMNSKPTGHANIGSKVTVGSHFYHVFTSEENAPQYSLDESENVILIDRLQALHAGVNALQGSFSLPFDGWLVNKGELISIDAATVAGDYLELLKSIICVETEAEVTPRGVCPRVWVNELSVTGE
ncbi:TldD/PmbA family protein [Aphanothece sacrum]|uniref:Modulator of DNA gyrase n=1 Tax=Aphanothece sacrum FPU1 TaxID=1920663 RepID=A0A401IL69_APHSA|nr:TldD/PmbA family protein [Aphanothece sacrum]GBF81999.1 modulator of DNA gyrase [Aphanothece sacrum FPU1]GBF83629.1 modulator of DNA gyrase PmbA [Aphanothece sacrum FPU3]